MRSLASLVTASLVTALALPAVARAHDLWLEPGRAGLVLRYGHRGGGLLAIPPAKVRTARCLAQGAARDLLSAASFGPTEVAFGGGPCETASVFLDGGYWSLTPDGEVNRPRNEVPQVVRAWASRQFAKWVDARSGAASSTVLGDELELVPAGDLSRARRGDKIAVRVLSRGQPVQNAVVAIDHRPLGESDSAGIVRLRLRASGVETISATLRRKVSTPAADAVVLEASLSFEVAR